MMENYDPLFPDQPVVDLYLPVWASLPSTALKPVFIWADAGANERDTLTYSQLNSCVTGIASNLLLPLQKGDTLLILCAPGLQLVQVIFGCQRAGLVGVPVIPPDPSFSSPQQQQHLIRVLRQTKPKAAVADREYISLVRAYCEFPGASTSQERRMLATLLAPLKWIPIETNAHCFAVGGDKGPPSSTYTGCQPEDVYLIQYTSGATGTPKPVVVTAGAAAHNVRAARKAYDLDLSTIFVSWLPQYHDCGLMFLLLTIVSGATCVLTSPSAFVQRPLLWLELISKYQATCTPVPSFALPLVARRGGPCLHKLDLRSLRNLVLINEPIYDSDVQDFLKVFADAGLHPSAIAPSYGLAENCTFVSTAWAPGGVPSFPDIPVHAQLLPSARLGSYDIDVDVHIVVVDEETFEQVEDGREGEIWVSSESNANGYLGQPWLSHEVFNCRLKGGVGRRFIRTGDRGIVLGHQRFLFVTGRCRDMIRSHDRTVHAHYLETRAYKSHPECLRGGCIAAFQVQNGEDQVVAIIAELQKGKDKGALSLVRICKGIQGSLFKEYGLEVGLVGLVKGGSLPKTSSGKMQRWAAKEKLARRELEVVQLVWFGKSCGSSGKGRAESLGPLNGPSMKYNGVHESRDWMLSYPHITSLL